MKKFYKLRGSLVPSLLGYVPHLQTAAKNFSYHNFVFCLRLNFILVELLEEDFSLKF
jgi:hypothetical protein